MGRRHFGISYDQVGDGFIACLLARLCAGDAGLRIAIYLDVIFSAFRTITHNPAADAHLAMLSRMKTFIRRQPSLRTLIGL